MTAAIVVPSGRRGSAIASALLGFLLGREGNENQITHRILP
jgi:hypothetical protein